MNVLLVLALSAALPLMAARGAEEEYLAGEAAFVTGDASAAEAHYRRAIEIDPNHLRAILRLATVVSWSDRLDESASLFERALQMDPKNREGRLGLARVSSWKGDLDRAGRLYEEVRGEDPANREATLGLARTRAWAGRHEEARRIYLQYLADHPQDVEARNGLAATLSWSGRLEESLALYEETLAADPSNRDALAGRARVLYWMGRTPQAWNAVGDALRVNPGDREALKIGSTIDEGMAPVLSASSGLLHDSDRNAVNMQHLGATYDLSPRAKAGVSYDRFAAQQPCTLKHGSHECMTIPEDPNALYSEGWLEGRVETIKGFGSRNTGRDLVLSGSAGVDQITHDDGGVSRFLVGSAGADWRIDDRWTLSGSASSETYAATARSLNRSVRVTAATITAGFAPVARVTTRWTLQLAAFSEDPDCRSNGVFPDCHPNQPGYDPNRPGLVHLSHNDRDLLAGYARWSVPVARPRLGLSWFGRWLSYGRDTGNGYFSPDEYWANLAGIDLGDRIGRRIGWSLSGTLGVQRVKMFPRSAGADSDWNNDAVYGYRAAASWEIVPGLSLEGYMGRTDLALAAGSGYRSTESGLLLRWRIGRRMTPGEDPASAEAGGLATPEEGAF